MGADEFHQHAAELVGDMRDQPIFVASDVKYDAIVRYEIDDRTKGALHVGRACPPCPGHDRKPGLQRPFGRRVPLPELNQSPTSNHLHRNAIACHQIGYKREPCLTPAASGVTHGAMSDTAANIAEYSVSEISAALKRTVEDAYGYVRVRGEISGYRGPHSSGHSYFSLKDDKARLEAVVWRGTLSRLKFKPEEGVEVVATGKLTTFAGQSKYQIVIEALEPAGVGALMALLEARRKALAAEGLFAEDRKRPLPYLPRVIGVVTSPTGAVIRDILHRLADRFPTRVLVWPVRVQGETSAAEVAAAIEGFNALPPGGALPRPDLLIVARGGGSLEDLWSFNEEVVVRAAASSAIPLISAVGHETDFTLIDYAADRRAPTPTAAAEMAVPVRSELIETVGGLGGRLAGATLRAIESSRRELRAAARALPRAEDLFAMPRRVFDELASRIGRALTANTGAHRTRFERVAGRLSLGGLDRMIERARERLVVADSRKAVFYTRTVERLRERLTTAGERRSQFLARGVERLRARLASAAKLLDVVSYRSILERGFALVSDFEDREPIRSAAGVPDGKVLDIEFHDGHVRAVSGGASDAKTEAAQAGRRRFAGEFAVGRGSRQSAIGDRRHDCRLPNADCPISTFSRITCRLVPVMPRSRKPASAKTGTKPMKRKLGESGSTG